MANESRETALRVAVEKEEQSRGFYASWAARVGDPGAAALLRELAAEEVRHKERLLEGLPLAQATGVPAGAAPDLSDFLVEHELSAVATTQDVLIAAIKREERARVMYLQLGKWVPAGALRDLLNSLADDEAGHKTRLEMIYDTLVLTDD